METGTRRIKGAAIREALLEMEAGEIRIAPRTYKYRIRKALRELEDRRYIVSARMWTGEQVVMRTI